MAMSTKQSVKIHGAAPSWVRQLLIPLILLFLAIGSYMILRTKAAVCEGCTPSAGLKIFDAMGSRTTASDWEGEPEVLPGLPSNLTSPINYADGDSYIRFEVLEKPSDLNTVVIVCANDQYFNERCSYKGVEYKLAFTGTGVIYANLGKPKDWQQVSYGQFNFDVPMHHPYLQFVDKERLDQVIANGADPNDLEFGEEATSVLNGFYYNASALSQHLPIKVDAELYFTPPNTQFVPPASWDCPIDVCPAAPTSTPTISPTPTIDPTPTLDPSPSPSPTLEPTPTVSPTPSPTPTGDLSKYDIDNSGTIGVGDLSRLIQDYPRQTGPVVSNSPADFNNSGRVDINDLSTLLRYWGQTV